MLFADVISELHVECSAWFLQAIVVILFLVSDVRAFQDDAVSAIFHAVAQRYIVTQLLWYDLLGGLGAGPDDEAVVVSDDGAQLILGHAGLLVDLESGILEDLHPVLGQGV